MSADVESFTDRRLAALEEALEYWAEADGHTIGVILRAAGLLDLLEENRRLGEQCDALRMALRGFVDAADEARTLTWPYRPDPVSAVNQGWSSPDGQRKGQ